MLSQKLQNDLMAAYHKVYEEKRGHAAGDSDTEKQASQLASDVRYKAKKKVPAGASKEEKRKIFLAILASSPAPNVVKAMAKTKLLGESALLNEIMPAGDTQAERTANVKKVVRGGFTAAKQVAKGVHDIRNSKIGKGVAGIAKRKGTLSQKLTGAAIDAVKGGVRSGVTRLQKFANEEKIIEGSAYGIYRGDGKVKIGQPPRKQKGAMAYDGPNKGRSEAADRVLAKTAAKRAKMKEEVVNEMSCGSPTVKAVKPKEKKMSPTVLDNIRKTNTGAGSQYESIDPQVMGEDKTISQEIVRQGIKVGGKSGGRAAQGAISGAKTATSNVKKDKKAGKGEKIGKVTGSIVGGAAGGYAGNKIGGKTGATAGAAAGSEVGERVGGAIGKKFDNKKQKKITNESQAPMGIKKPILGGHTTERPKPKKPGEIGGTLGKLFPKPTVKEGMDPVGKEDGDINNDGKKDGTDKYLASRRKAIGKAIAKKRGRVKEGFSAWRVDLDFQESVKK